MAATRRTPTRNPTKAELRATYRRLRRELPGRASRSIRIWLHVTALPEVRAARRVLAYRAVPGEPETDAFLVWCHESGKHVDLTASDPAAPFPDDPSVFDAVLVPGLAFAPDGRRLGQGGGWYDRLLAQLPGECLTVGVCFAEQLVDDLPSERHDVAVAVVVTEAGTSRSHALPRVDESSGSSVPSGHPTT